MENKNNLYRYIVINAKSNLENEFVDAVAYHLELNTWIVEFETRNLNFEEKLSKYIIGINDLTLEKMIINNLHLLNFSISTAESCTGGLIMSRLISVSGASNVINEGYITYSEEAKQRILGVKKETIKKYNVASMEVAEEMALGLARVSKANIAISVTGYTKSSTYDPNEGMFYFCIFVNEGDKDYTHIEKEHFDGTREEIRYQQVTYILWRTLTLLKSIVEKKNIKKIK